MMKRLFAAFFLALTALSAQAKDTFNLPRGVTPISHDIYNLHMMSIYLCSGIGIVVFGFLIYNLIMFRKSKGAVAGGVNEHLGVEIVWTVIPFILLVLMAIPATRVLSALEDTRKPEINIKVTGYQWKWKYDYLDDNVSFFSVMDTPLAQINGSEPKDKHYLLEVDHPLVVPVGVKIRLLVTSNDVVHSWWVPDLAVKQDAIPGYVNETWTQIEKPGIYRGQCSELCGAFHGFMPIVVKAVPMLQYKAWLAKHQKPETVASAAQHFTKAQLFTMGKKVYNKNCAACHQPNGEGLKPVFPAIKGSSVALGDVQRHIQLVLNGVPGTAMQAFGAQLSNKDIAAVITYQRNAWGNDRSSKSPVVEPQDIKKARNG